MVGLIYLLLIWAYFYIARAIYRAVKLRSQAKANYWAGFVVALPAWFFFGYLLSGSYREFRTLCDSNEGPQIVRPVPTNIPYSQYCDRGLIGGLANGSYEAVECKEGGQTVRYRFTGGERKKCQPGSWQADTFEVCFDRVPIERVTTPNNWTHAELTETRESLLFVGRLEKLRTSNSLPDGTLVAFTQNYRYFPQGSAVWLGASSGQAPMIQCNRRARLPMLGQMFPPAGPVNE